MISFFTAVRHNLVSLIRFSGRDTPGQFWPYAGLVFAFLFIITAAVMLPPIASTVARVQGVTAHAAPSAAGEMVLGAAGSQVARAAPMPNVQGIVQPLILLSALGVFLLAAAIVRRLHDCNRSGLWASAPLVFLLTGLALMPRLFRNFATANQADFTLFFALFANNLLYLVSLLILALLLAAPGTGGHNSYGPDPRRR